MPAKKPDIPDTFNEKLAKRLELSGEKLLTTLEAAIDAEKTYGVKCPRACCSDTNGFQATFPDVRAMLAAAQWWTEYVHGKASAQAPKVEKPKATGKSIADMTDQELAELTEAA